MSAEQQAAAAFDRELQHAVSSLPPKADHASVLQHHRGIGKLQELLDHYNTRLPGHCYGPLLLAAADRLLQRQEHGAAAVLHARLVAMRLPDADGSKKLDTAARLKLHVQALYGLHSCRGIMALQADSQLHHQHSVAAVLDALAGLQAACTQAMPAQPLLVVEGTKQVHHLAEQVSACGLHSQVLPFLKFAATAMECHINLSSTGHLPWRVQLYTIVARCYCAVLGSRASNSSASASASSGSSTSAGDGSRGQGACTPGSSAEEAHSFLAAGLQQLEKLAHVQALDAVPAPDVTAAILAARSQMLLLQMLFVMPAAAGVAASGHAEHSSHMQGLLPGLGNDQEQLTALVGLLEAGLLAGGTLAPLQQVAVPEHLHAAMQAAGTLVERVLGLGATTAEVASSNNGCSSPGGAKQRLIQASQAAKHSDNRTLAMECLMMHVLTCFRHCYDHSSCLRDGVPCLLSSLPK